jgi:hypothetical protein
VHLLLSENCSFVAVAEWICDLVAVVIESHVIDCPAVDSDRAKAFGCDASAQAQPRLYTSDHCSDIPAHTLRSDHRRIAKTMHDMYVRVLLLET